MRLIDADARVIVQYFDVEHEEYCHTEMTVEAALDFGTDEGCPPIIDAAPVVHGWWTDKDSLSCRCSCCGCKSSNEYKYCPNCGAKMDGDNQEEK